MDGSGLNGSAAVMPLATGSSDCIGDTIDFDDSSPDATGVISIQGTKFTASTYPIPRETRWKNLEADCARVLLAMRLDGLSVLIIRIHARKDTSWADFVLEYWEADNRGGPKEMKACGRGAVVADSTTGEVLSFMYKQQLTEDPMRHSHVNHN